MPNIELLRSLRKVVLTEMEKRARQRGLELGKDMRTILYEKLDRMAENRRRLGDELPPLTGAQKADLGAFLERLAQRPAKNEAQS
jgi:hypothetical protein